MTLRQGQNIFTENVGKLIDYAYNHGFSLSFGEAYRTKEQAEIYAREGKGILNSLHCKRLAVDFNLFSPDGVFLNDRESYLWLGEYWLTLNPNNRWGGNFKTRNDPYHFEMFVPEVINI